MRSLLGRFLFTGDDVFKQVRDLSGGEKAKLSLLKLMLSGANTLILDEPTNHLDLDAINALSIALSSYNGGLLIVSHDRNFVENVCNDIYMIENKKCKKFRGNFNDYRNYLRGQNEKNKQMKLKI
jgi:ATP-binding cassette subfamily F protein 3